LLEEFLVGGEKMDLDKEIKELEEKASKLKKLKEAFPDLKQDIDRWNNVRYYSKSVNGKVDNAEIRHTCGCCNDAGVLVCPYLETEGGRIYSDPARFYPGEREPYSYTDQPRGDWERAFKNAGINEAAINKVRLHFEYEASKYKDYYDNLEKDEE
jgi:hypothetical protein